MKTSSATLFLLLFIGFIGSSQSIFDTESLLEIHGKAFKRAEILKEADLTSLTIKEEIRLQLFSDITIVARRNTAVKQSYGGNLWKGELTSGAQGYLELFSRNGKISGTVYTTSKVYKLDGSSQGDLRVIELHPGELPKHQESGSTSENNNYSNRSGKSLIESRATATNPSIIDVMVLYPASVQTLMGGAAAMENEVYYRVAEANQAFINSGIYVEFRLAHHQVVTSVNEDAEDTDEIKTTEVNNLREQYKADLVSFWNRDGTTGSGSNFGGTGDPSDGFNTCNISAVQSQYTFIHECGHNLGAKHDRQTYYEDSPTNSKLDLDPYFHYGKSFVGYRSIMSYSNCSELSGGSSRDCERVPYFTNPDIIVNGAPFGVEVTFQTFDVNGPANNALRINETAPYVANYYDSPSIVYYDLTVTNGLGAGEYIEGDIVSISANTALEDEVFDQWVGDISSIVDSHKASTFITITNEDLSITATYKSDTALSTDEYQLAIDIDVFPNPIEDVLNINLNRINTASIEVVNMTGQVVFFKEIVNSVEQLNVENLDTGLYILKVSNDNKLLTKTIVKQ